jgi:hypothetical protein
LFLVYLYFLSNIFLIFSFYIRSHYFIPRPINNGSQFERKNR